MTSAPPLEDAKLVECIVSEAVHENITAKSSDDSQIEQVVVTTVSSHKTQETTSSTLQEPIADQQVSKKLSDDVVVLPDPNLREALASAKLPAVEPESVRQETDNKSDKKKKTSKEQTSASCFKCKSNKKEATTSDEKKKKEKKNKTKKSKEADPIPTAVPWVKKQLVVEVTKPEEEAAQTSNASPARPQLDLSPVEQPKNLPQQPPKKPPRGHLDTTLMNIDVDMSLPVDVTLDAQPSLHVETLKPLTAQRYFTIF